MFRKPVISIVSGLLALIFTIYITFDTFVISRVYSTVENNTETVVINQNEAINIYGSENDTSVSESDSNTVLDELDNNTIISESDNNTILGEAGNDTSVSEPDNNTIISEPVITDTSYIDNNISITISTQRVNNTDVYVADIVLSSPEYLKTALADNSYGKNITDKTSNMAVDNNAILAINGDYYGVQERGYVIRNGVLYRSTSKGDQEDLVIYSDGSMEVINENNISAEELMATGVYNLLCFGPGLIKDGEIAVSVYDEVDKAMTSNPRTGIGIIDELHYVFVVADGRTSASEGLSLYELANFMKGLNVTTAYNLDGGGSSTMYFNGEIINNPTTGGGRRKNYGSSERSVSDIVYIGY